MNKLFVLAFALLVFCQTLRSEPNAAIGGRKIKRFTVSTTDGWTLSIDSQSGYLIFSTSSFNSARFEGISPQKAFATLVPDLDLAQRSPEEANELMIKNGVYVTAWFVDATEKETFPLSKTDAVRSLIDAAATVWEPTSASRFSDLLSKHPIFPSWQPSASRGRKVWDRLLKSE